MFLHLDDADVLVSAFGAGPKTLLAHGGWVGSGEVWYPTFEPLSRRWRTITYDHRGTGATLSRAPCITHDRLVDDLFRVLDALGVETCVLGAESAGATITLEAAVRDRTRFEGLVIVDGRYRGGRSEGSARLIEGCRADFSATMDAFIAACFPEPDCDAVRRWARQIVDRSNATAAVELMESADDAALEQRLGEIDLPALILHGRQDAIVPLAAAQQLAEVLPMGKLIILEETGHVPTMSRPTEVAREIEVFFGQQSV